MAERYANYNRDFPLNYLGRDEDGHKRYGCRKCGARVPKRCRSFCSDECREDVLVRCGIDVRDHVGKRDKGICSRCGTNTAALASRLSHAWKRHHAYYFKPIWASAASEADDGLSQPYHYWRSSFMIPYCCPGARGRELIVFSRFLHKIGVEIVDLDGKSFWEAHHKIAVKDGGGGCGLDGLETLCRWCHKSESASQHARWAKERRKDDGQMTLIEGEM